MDFYPRESKQQGAWCVTYRNHYLDKGSEVKPIVTTVFNFTLPVADQPALISLEEALTLYHEMGHALDVLFNKRQMDHYLVAEFAEITGRCFYRIGGWMG
jgi:peptidyl-dipeptidase Dcp